MSTPAERARQAEIANNPDDPPEQHQEDHVRSPAPDGGGEQDGAPPAREERRPVREREVYQPDAARDSIAERIRARRAAEAEEDARLLGDMPVDHHDLSPEERREAADRTREPEQTSREPEARKEPDAKPQAQGYELTVFGDTVKVADRAELCKLAGIDPKEAEGLPDTRLVTWAQKELAADRRFAASKEATQKRDPAPTPPPNQGQDGKPGKTETGEDQADQPDPYQKAVETIQYGTAEEGAQVLKDLVKDAVNEARKDRTEDENLKAVERAVNAAETLVARDNSAFEQAEADLLSDEARAEAFYNHYVVREVRKDFVANKVPEANANRLLVDADTALTAYTAGQAAGYNLRSPAEILAAAKEAFVRSTGYGGRARQDEGGGEAHLGTQVTDRRDAKRGQDNGPIRGASSPQVGDRRPAKDPTLSVIEEMRAARGQR